MRPDLSRLSSQKTEFDSVFLIRRCRPISKEVIALTACRINAQVYHLHYHIYNRSEALEVTGGSLVLFPLLTTLLLTQPTCAVILLLQAKEVLEQLWKIQRK